MAIGLGSTIIVLLLYGWRTVSVIEVARIQRVAFERMDREHATILDNQRQILEGIETLKARR